MYVVKSGDYLSLIGQRLGIPWQEIAALNNIKPPYTIFSGQALKLPDKNKKQAPVPVSQPSTARQYLHVFQFRKYDSLFSVIRVPVARFGFMVGIAPVIPAWTTLDKLMVDNNADAGIVFSFSDNRQGWPLGPTVKDGQGRHNYPHQHYASLVLDDMKIREPREVYPPGQLPLFKNVLSSRPRLLREGQVDFGTYSPPATRHPYGAVGITRHKTEVVFVAVDGRGNASSRGVNHGQIANVCRYLGCWDALACDGGGVVKLMVKQLNGFGYWTMTSSHESGRRIVAGLLASLKQ